MTRSIAAVVLLVGCASSVPAHAEHIVDPNALHPNAVTTNFESIAPGTPVPIYDGFMLITTSPLSAVTVLAHRPGDVQVSRVFEGNFVGHNEVDWLISFDAPVSQFGMGIFDPNYAGNVLRALDASGNILEEVISGSTEFPISGSANTLAVYLGFIRPTNDISRIELIHAHPNGQYTGDHLSIDNVAYYVTPSNVVPCPNSAVCLVGVGVMVFGGRWLTQRRRRPRATA